MGEQIKGASMDINGKLEKLNKYIKDMGSVAVAFSSGVDSTFLLKTAHNILGDNVIAVTAGAYFFPKRELEEAKNFCQKEGIRHFICADEDLDTSSFSHNPQNRCYLCKKEFFSKITDIAAQNGIKNVIEGSNADDVNDYRPGMKAIEELNVKSPLKYAGLTKEEIRTLSKQAGLDVWNKPSLACLASRFVYGEEITPEKANMVDKAEQLLFGMGFSQVRVRIHGKIARIEIPPEEFSKLLEKDNREVIVKNLKNFGFTYISMDLTGYRTGSMNEELKR